MKILLIHGLSRSPLSLLSLDWHLQWSGHHTEQFGYAAFAESFDQIVERLQAKIKAIAATEPYAIVAHSLGGLLIRAALGSTSVALPEHVVMLGPPNQSPRLATFAWQLLPFRWWTGQCGFNLTNQTFFESLPTLKSPYTIIAGTGGFRGIFSPFGDELNDGIVALSETRLSHDDQIIQFPVMHTFMMNYGELQHRVQSIFSVLE